MKIVEITGKIEISANSFDTDEDNVKEVVEGFLRKQRLILREEFLSCKPPVKNTYIGHEV